uniref:Protein YIPF n=1 Tax=Globodera rostochiensis TaxID=31243 RepID=A0A914H659_GLORO
MTDPYAYFYDNNSGRREGGTASPYSSNQQQQQHQQDVWYNGGTAPVGGGGSSPATAAPDFVSQPQFNVHGAAVGHQQQSPTGFFNGGYGMNSQQSTASPNQQYYANYYAAQQPTNMFIPAMPAQETAKGFDDGDYGIDNEPPLLEELGVNFEHIWLKTMAVLNPLGIASPDVIADQDLAGPLVFCLLFGASLLLHGKIQFGHIYGIGLCGCVGMYALLNLMASEQRSISFTSTASVLGYCLLPMSLLSLLAAVLSLQGVIGYIIVALAVFWSGSASSKLFSIALSMSGQRLLVAYPCTLLYSVFALLAIF